MQQVMTTLQGEKVYLVFACAWCPKWTLKKLRRNEQYSHGICEKHLSLELEEYKHSKQRYEIH